MFKINDYIMYGTTGVCQVSDITKEAIGGFKLKEYYVLTHIYTNNTIIKVPIDNNKIPMRKIMSKSDISNIIAPSTSAISVLINSTLSPYSF